MEDLEDTKPWNAITPIMKVLKNLQSKITPETEETKTSYEHCER